jgi:AraC-like DNA-binding protein
MKRTHSIVSRALRKAEICMTEVRDDDPKTAMTKPLPPEDAFVAVLVLRDYPGRQYWELGRPAPRADLRAGEVVLYDLKRDPVALIDKPYHSLHFHLPRSALNDIADDASVPHIGDLDYQPGAGKLDPTFGHLARSLLPALERPEEASRLFIDHVALAVAAHVAQAYGGMHNQPRTVLGGLAPWQERRAKEMLGANLQDTASLDDISQACGLSVSYFSRAFRKSTGVAPHRWLIQRRVETAKALLRANETSLSEVALHCGFADQSHFTRTFSEMVGVSPGTFRRQIRA